MEAMWESRLRKNKNGKLCTDLFNVYLIFSYHPAWNGLFKKSGDEIIFQRDTRRGGKKGETLRRTDYSRAIIWLTYYLGKEPSRSVVKTIVKVVAEDSVLGIPGP